MSAPETREIFSRQNLKNEMGRRLTAQPRFFPSGFDYLRNTEMSCSHETAFPPEESCTFAAQNTIALSSAVSLSITFSSPSPILRGLPNWRTNRAAGLRIELLLPTSDHFTVASPSNRSTSKCIRPPFRRSPQVAE